ncbi:MAG: hypothetical protein HYT11_01870 [Candidatus Levybacteria bacterium]|nr:hypothetical protein [Candidatus Levybacteria bacterium]
MAASASSCPQSNEAVANYLGGDPGDYHLLFKSGPWKVSWKMTSVQDEMISWPKRGRIDFGGREDGSGVQHGFSTKKFVRRAPMNQFAWHCLGERGKNNGFPVSQFPRNLQMVAKLVGGEAQSWTYDDETNLNHWMYSGPSTLLNSRFGRLDIATNGG